jgi:hypothetical protein
MTRPRFAVATLPLKPPDDDGDVIVDIGLGLELETVASDGHGTYLGPVPAPPFPAPPPPGAACLRPPRERVRTLPWLFLQARPVTNLPDPS